MALSSRFQKSQLKKSDKKNLLLGFCLSCATVQWLSGWTQHEITEMGSRFTYREPESHLDSLADELASLAGISPITAVWGVSEKDNSLVRRLKERGLGSVINNNFINESYDLIIARHVMEHAPSLPQFLSELAAKLRPNGYLFLETPDSQDIFEMGDFSQVWEEHFIYFTSATLRRALGYHGWHPIKEWRFSAVGVGETPLGILVKRTQEAIMEFPNPELEFNQIKNFEIKAERLKQNWKCYLTYETQNEKRLAIFGAGHITTTFLQLGNLSSFFEIIFDDTPEKIGTLLPGTPLSILATSEIPSLRITTLVLGVSVQSEGPIIQRLRHEFGWHGDFVSLNPKSPQFPKMIRDTLD